MGGILILGLTETELRSQLEIWSLSLVIIAYLFFVIRPWVRTNSVSMFQSWGDFFRGVMTIVFLFGLIFVLIYVFDTFFSADTTKASSTVSTLSSDNNAPYLWGASKKQFLQISDMTALILLAIAVISFAVRPLVNAVFQALPKAAQKAEARLLAKGALSNQPLRPLSPWLHKIILILGPALMGLFIYIMMGLQSDQANLLSNRGSTNLENNIVYRGLSKNELLDLAEFLVRMASIVLIFVLVFRPLIMRAFVALPKAANMKINITSRQTWAIALFSTLIAISAIVIVEFQFVSAIMERLDFS